MYTAVTGALQCIILHILCIFQWLLIVLLFLWSDHVAYGKTLFSHPAPNSDTANNNHLLDVIIIKIFWNLPMEFTSLNVTSNNVWSLNAITSIAIGLTTDHYEHKSSIFSHGW